MAEPSPGRRDAVALGGSSSAGLAPAILLAESAPALGAALRGLLIADGYEVGLAGSSRHAEAMLARRAWRLAVIGQLESARGPLDLLALLGDEVPALVIGATGDQLALVRAFEAGADDFMSSPPSQLELRLRVRALLRRGQAPAAAGRTITVGDLRIDSLRRTVTLRGRCLDLRRLEYELLLRLAADPSRVLTRHELLAEVWGYPCACSTRTLDSHASRLRRKLAAVDGGRWVLNVRAVGYRLI